MRYDSMQAWLLTYVTRVLKLFARVTGRLRL